MKRWQWIILGAALFVGFCWCCHQTQLSQDALWRWQDAHASLLH